MSRGNHNPSGTAGQGGGGAPRDQSSEPGLVGILQAQIEALLAENRRLKRLARSEGKTRHSLSRLWGGDTPPDGQRPPYYISIGKLPHSATRFMRMKAPSDSGHSDQILYEGLPGFPGLDSETPFETQNYREGCTSYTGLIKRFLAAQLYTLLGDGSFYVRKHRFAMLNPLHQLTENIELTKALINETNQKRPAHKKITETLHLLSRVIQYITSATLQACYLNAKDEVAKTFLDCLKTGHVPEYAMIDGVKLPILGLMELLAASRLLADVDVFGRKAQNVGFVVETTADGRPIALRAVKLDASETFSWEEGNQFTSSFNPKSRAPKLNNQKDLQFSQFNSPNIQWVNLSAHQQLNFLTALQRGYEALYKTSLLDFMLYRNDAWSSLTPGTTLLTSEIITEFRTYLVGYMDDQLLTVVYGPLLTPESLEVLQTEANKNTAHIPEMPFNPKVFNAASFTVADAKAEAERAEAEAKRAEAEAKRAEAEAEASASPAPGM